MAHTHFRRGSGAFRCRHCKRLTRDTNGSNGDLELCDDCSEGFMWDNGGNDTDDAAKKAECFTKADAHFQAAVDKGGVIEGYASKVAEP